MATRKQVKILIIILFTLLLVKCANQLPPTGGDVDTIPPEIIEAYPPDRTVNYNEQYVEFTFSEYVDKRSVKDAIFISPTIDGQLEYNWSGKTLEIEFPDSLKKNTTYTFTIGIDVKDINNGNHMENSFTLTFSTGTKIDNGTIAGKVYDNKPLGILICAYRSDSTEIDFTNQKPDYISQVGNSGDYTITGLAEGEYKLIALRDAFMDFLYNIGEDSYGVPFKKIYLSRKDSLVSGVDFMLTKEDATIPHVFGITMTDRNHLLVEFSEFIDSSKLSSGNFSIYDSTALQSIDVKHVFKGKAKDKEYFLSIGDTIPVDHNAYLISKNIVDSYGNILTEESTSFTVNENPDTLKPELIKVSTGNSQNKIDLYNTEIFIELNDAVNIDDNTSFARIMNSDSTYIESSLKRIDDAKFKLVPAVKLKSNTTYLIVSDLSKTMDDAGNVGDTLIVTPLNTKNELDYSGVYGKIITSNNNFDKIKVVLKRLNAAGDNQPDLSGPIKRDGKFEFPKVIPGKYLLFSYYDSNDDNKFTYGKLKPYTLSEKFNFFSDTLNLRARWPVGDVFINMD